MPALSELAITPNTDFFRNIGQNLRIRKLELSFFYCQHAIIKTLDLFPNVESLRFIYYWSYKQDLKLLEAINKNMTKLKKFSFDHNVDFCMPTVQEVSFPSELEVDGEICKKNPFKQFLDANKQIQIVHLNENFKGKVDLSQHENVKIVKYFKQWP